MLVSAPVCARVRSALCAVPCALVAALAAVSAPAYALELPAPPCAVPQAQAAPGTPELPAAALQRMLAQLPLCQKDAIFLAALGQLLNRQERYLEAADHLERALMLEPDLKDAQLSYAIALTGSGDVVSAQALIDNLLNDADLPAALRPLIARQKAMLASASVVADPYAWQKRFTLATRLGYDSNLLGSPNLSSLALNLFGQTIVAQLDESYLARAASYARADAQLEFSRTAPDGARWDAVASLRARTSPSIPTAGSNQVDLLLERSTILTSQASTSGGASPSGNGNGNGNGNGTGTGSYVTATVSSLRSNAGTRFTALGFSGGWGIAWHSAAAGTCQSRAGMEFQERKYQDNEVLSGRYTGASLSWSCESTSGAQLLLNLKAGYDQAQDPSRPGGDQQQASLRVGAYLPQAFLMFGTPPVSLSPVAGRLRNGFLLDFEHSQQQDASGYSSIIDSGRSRKISRSAARVEYQYFFSKGIQASLGAEWIGQTSNIELFRLTSRGVYSGVRASW